MAGADRAFPDSPAIVAAEGHDVDLLARALAHVADVELARSAAVEGEAPWVAHANGEDLVAPGRRAEERIARWRRIGRLAAVRKIHVDAQDLAEQLVDVLRTVAGIVAGAAIAHPDVEEPVGAERQHAAVVVGERLRDLEEGLLGEVGDVRIAHGSPVLRDHGGAVRLARVVDEEATVRRELRVEGESEQAPLAAREHLCGDVEEDRRRGLAGLQHLDDAGPLEHEQPIAAVPRVRHEEGAAQAGEHRLELDGGRV